MFAFWRFFFSLFPQSEVNRLSWCTRRQSLRGTLVVKPENTYNLPVQKEKYNPEQITKTTVSCTLEPDCSLSCEGQ